MRAEDDHQRVTFTGVSAAALAAIPAILAAGAAGWLGFYLAASQAHHDMEVRRRENTEVSASVLPTAPIRLHIDNRKGAPLQVTKVVEDGDDLRVFYRNVGKGAVTFIQFTHKETAPDGTVIGGSTDFVNVTSKNNAPSDLGADERAVADFVVPVDDKAVAMTVSMTGDVR